MPIIADADVPHPECQKIRAAGFKLIEIQSNARARSFSDDRLVSFLHTYRLPTFISHDRTRFANRRAWHPRLCIIAVVAPPHQIAALTLKVLKHPNFKNARKRKGTVLIVRPTGVVCYRSLAGKAERHRLEG